MRSHLSLITVLIATAVFMPLMVFMTANSSVFAGNMVRVEGLNPDGESRMRMREARLLRPEEIR